MIKSILKVVLTLLLGGLLYYLMLPPINLSSPLFWIFIIIMVSFYLFISLFTMSINKLQTVINRKKVVNKTESKIPQHPQ